MALLAHVSSEQCNTGAEQNDVTHVGGVNQDLMNIWGAVRLTFWARRTSTDAKNRNVILTSSKLASSSVISLKETKRVRVGGSPPPPPLSETPSHLYQGYTKFSRTNSNTWKGKKAETMLTYAEIFISVFFIWRIDILMAQKFAQTKFAGIVCLEQLVDLGRRGH